ncbi:hypothetical protein BH11CYA1_BH11CYA1_15890 [soil metagenome]
MSRSKVEGTKIAQAAKDLNVTSVTIRRYIQEFEIETATDENGIKVLPAQALEELQEIRKLKEDGLTNPKVMEQLEEMRSAKTDEKPSKAKARGKATKVVATKAKKAVVEVEDQAEDDEEEEIKPEPVRKVRAVKIVKAQPKEDADEKEKEDESSSDSDSNDEQSAPGEGGVEGEKFMHSLTCQTCAKTFEHNNPRLRDCLDCYRAKRKERRRGGGEKHKKVIENPLATQVLSKQSPVGQSAQAGVEAKDGERLDRLDRPDRPERSDKLERPDRPDRGDRQERGDRADRPERTERDPAARTDREPRRDREPRERDGREREARERPERVAVAAAMPAAQRSAEPSSWAQMQKPVRSYRKAIEETRLITGSLKRRLERPDLPEGERRWLEQVYAYQLILHQGWRHLAEYKSGSPTQKPQQED